MVIYGNAKPPYGPVDIVVQNGLITSITGSPDSKERDAGVEAGLPNGRRWRTEKGFQEGLTRSKPGRYL